MIYDWYSSACSEQNFDDNLHLEYYYYVATGKDPENILADWQKRNLKANMGQELESWQLDAFLKDNIFENNINLSVLPENSFVIQFKFILKKPYISIDEQEFYIIDNPIRKDKVFNLPYIAPSSWKGSLRSALFYLGYNSENEKIQNIFGNKNTENDELLMKGRVHLFPTFFKEKGLEIINPHIREKRVGTVPILFECVPAGESGTFTLLYVPYYLFLDFDEENFKKQIFGDLLLLSEGLKSMFLTYGFGAKTSSGFGIAENNLIEGKIILKSKCVTASVHENIKPPEKEFLKYLNEDGTLRDSFKNADGNLITNITGEKLSQIGGGSLNEFKLFKKCYKDDGHKWQKHLQSKNETSVEWPTWSFKTFDELIDVANNISQNLQNFKEVGQ
jgi:CRISPR-associated protein Cmr2